MRTLIWVLVGSAAFAASSSVFTRSSSNFCTTSAVAKALPLNLSTGIAFDPSSVTAAPVYNYSVVNADFQPDAVFDFCNVSFAYSHSEKDDLITLTFWLPVPSNFANRYLSTGGGGYAINSGSSGLAMGVPFGAVTGITDGGLGTADNLLNPGDFLMSNGSVNWNEVYLFGYSAHHELALIGKAFSKTFYGMGSNRLYAYYQGCSEGGREGFSQIQRFSGQFDGSVVGAPAFRLPFQQVQHLYAGVVEQTMNHYPPSCAFELILNETITACDPLDGLTDGVVSRSDLCMLHFDISSLVGKKYSCPAQAETFEHGPASPATNGTLTETDIAVAKECLNGLHDSLNRRAYFTYQPGSYFTDAATSYNSSSGAYYTVPSSLGGGWVTEALEEVGIENLVSLEGITYDDLVNYMNVGMHKYYDSLLTTWPDLTAYLSGGSKIIHFHGESDYSIPTASSVRYHESVREVMYGNLSLLEGAAALGEWYRLFLVPGAGHCAPEALQPNGPFPQTNLQVMIDWVEKDEKPIMLNATHLAGENRGANAQICAWPMRPLWATNGTMECVFDKQSYDSWIYDLDAFKVPVY